MRLKIASYNVHKAVGQDRRRDPARILNVLAGIDADVAVLQEVDRRLAPRPTAIPRSLIERETDYEVVHLARNDVSLGWHGNAVFVRRGLGIAEAGHIELPGLEPRGAVFVKIGGLSVVGTHLGLLRSWRQKQMKTILEHVGGQAETTLIAGDFNEWSDIRGFEPWEHHFRVLYPGRSFPSRRPIAARDGIAHGSGISVHEHGVADESKARVASDHLPIWAEIELAPARG